MACVMDRPKPPPFWMAPSLLLCFVTCAHCIPPQLDVPQVDTTYVDPNRYTYSQQGVRPLYGGDNRRYNDEKELGRELLDRFIKTQNPRYYDPQRYEQDGGGGRDGVQRENPSVISTQQLQNLLKQVDEISSQQCTSNVLAQWNFETNVNSVTQLEAVSTV